MKTYQVNEFVFVNPNRGKTPGIARVTKVINDEAEIVYDNGEKDRYYFVHLHQKMECFKRRQKFLAERAEKIGKKCLKVKQRSKFQNFVLQTLTTTVLFLKFGGQVIV